MSNINYYMLQCFRDEYSSLDKQDRSDMLKHMLNENKNVNIDALIEWCDSTFDTHLLRCNTDFKTAILNSINYNQLRWWILDWMKEESPEYFQVISPPTYILQTNNADARIDLEKERCWIDIKKMD